MNRYLVFILLFFVLILSLEKSYSNDDQTIIIDSLSKICTDERYSSPDFEIIRNDINHSCQLNIKNNLDVEIKDSKNHHDDFMLDSFSVKGAGKLTVLTDLKTDQIIYFDAKDIEIKKVNISSNQIVFQTENLTKIVESKINSQNMEINASEVNLDKKSLLQTNNLLKVIGRSKLALFGDLISSKEINLISESLIGTYTDSHIKTLVLFVNAPRTTLRGDVFVGIQTVLNVGSLEILGGGIITFFSDNIFISTNNLRLGSGAYLRYSRSFYIKCDGNIEIDYASIRNVPTSEGPLEVIKSHGSERYPWVDFDFLKENFNYRYQVPKMIMPRGKTLSLYIEASGVINLGDHSSVETFQTAHFFAKNITAKGKITKYIKLDSPVQFYGTHVNLDGEIYSKSGLNVNGNEVVLGGKSDIKTESSINMEGTNFSQESGSSVETKELLTLNFETGTIEGVLSSGGGMQLDIKTLNLQKSALITSLSKINLIGKTYNHEEGAKVLSAKEVIARYEKAVVAGIIYGKSQIDFYVTEAFTSKKSAAFIGEKIRIESQKSLKIMDSIFVASEIKTIGRTENEVSMRINGDVTKKIDLNNLSTNDFTPKINILSEDEVTKLQRRLDLHDNEYPTFYPIIPNKIWKRALDEAPYSRNVIIRSFGKVHFTGDIPEDQVKVIANEVGIEGKNKVRKLNVSRIDFQNQFIKDLNLSNVVLENLFAEGVLDGLALDRVRKFTVKGNGKLEITSDKASEIRTEEFEVERGGELHSQGITKIDAESLLKIEGAVSSIGKLFLNGKKVSIDGIVSGKGDTQITGEFIDIGGKVSSDGANLHIKATRDLTLKEVSSVAASQILLHSDNEMKLAGALNASEGILVDFKNFDLSKISGTLNSGGWIAFNGDIDSKNLHTLITGNDRKIAGKEITVITTKPIVIDKNVDVAHSIKIKAPTVTLDHRQDDPQNGIVFKSGQDVLIETDSDLTINTGVQIKSGNAFYANVGGNFIRQGELNKGRTKIESGDGGITINAGGGYQDIAGVTQTTGKIIIKAEKGFYIVPLVYQTSTTRVEKKHFGLKKNTITTTTVTHTNPEYSAGKGATFETTSEGNTNSTFFNIKINSDESIYKVDGVNANMDVISEADSVTEDVQKGGVLRKLEDLGKKAFRTVTVPTKKLLKGENLKKVGKSVIDTQKDFYKAQVDLDSEAFDIVKMPKDLQKVKDGVAAGVKDQIDRSTTLKGAISIAGNAALIAASGGSAAVIIGAAAANSALQTFCQEGEKPTLKKALRNAAVGGAVSAVTCGVGDKISVGNAAAKGAICGGLTGATQDLASQAIDKKGKINFHDTSKSFLLGSIGGAASSQVTTSGGHSILGDLASLGAKEASDILVYGKDYDPYILGRQIGSTVVNSTFQYVANEGVAEGMDYCQRQDDIDENDLAYNYEDRDRDELQDLDDRSPSSIDDRDESGSDSEGAPQSLEEGIIEICDELSTPLNHRERTELLLQDDRKGLEESHPEDIFFIGGPLVGGFKAVGRTLCFTGDTPVCIRGDLNKNGHGADFGAGTGAEEGSAGPNFQNIEDLKIGDLVESCSDPLEGVCELRPITEVYQRFTDRLIVLSVEGGVTLKTTPEHPFYVQGDTNAYVEAKDLRAGDELLLVDGSSLSVQKIEEEVKPNASIPVYNIEVEGNHNYYVSNFGILVHNCNRAGRALAKEGAEILMKEGTELAEKEGTRLLERGGERVAARNGAQKGAQYAEREAGSAVESSAGKGKLNPQNRAQHEMQKVELRREMQKPHVENPDLKKSLDSIYRDNAEIGSGSSASAVRQEKLTGEPVKGKFHTQKAQDSIRNLENWLKNNPNAKPGDKAAAENVIKDLNEALGY